MNKIIVGAIALCIAGGAQADHHGRGREQLNGFPGIYDLGQGVATFTHDGHWVVTSRDARVAITIMTYAIKDGVMTIGTISPPAFAPDALQACMRSTPGTYAIVDKQGGFSLRLLADPCTGRADLLQRFDFADYKKPE